MAGMKEPKKTNRYPDEFKIKAVQLADHPEIHEKDVADDLGVHPIVLCRWRKEYREGRLENDGRRKQVKIEPQKVSEMPRIQQLECEIKKLRTQNELLKKTIEFNSEEKNRFSSS